VCSAFFFLSVLCNFMWCVLCLIVVPLPPDKHLFAVKIVITFTGSYGRSHGRSRAIIRRSTRTYRVSSHQETRLNDLGRRELLKSQMKQEFLIWVRARTRILITIALSTVTSGCTFSLAERVTPLYPTNVSYYAQARLSHLHHTLHSLSWFKNWFATRIKWQQASPKGIINLIYLLQLSRQTIHPEHLLQLVHNINRTWSYPGIL
jgi:hypothetical protein